MHLNLGTYRASVPRPLPPLRPVGHLAQQFGAFVELRHGHELVRLVGLGDAAGAADDGGDARSLEQAGLGAEPEAERDGLAAFLSRPPGAWAIFPIANAKVKKGDLFLPAAFPI